MKHMGTKISLGPWGGPGGDSWTYNPNAAIEEIVIHHSGAINSISFKDSNGYISGTFGGHDPLDRGREDKIIINCPTEYLKSISGKYGNHKGLLVIKSLFFHTNITTYGPFGHNNGEDFSVPMEQSVFIGFHGTAGYFLHSIGIHVAPENADESISLGPWGGQGGDAFNFVTKSWIKQIIIEHGAFIESISFVDANGDKYGKYGGQGPFEHGDTTKITIEGPLEYLKSISGSYGMCRGEMLITSLSFITNYSTYGPFGNENGTFFSLPIQGNEVNGFHGKVGHYVDAIGIYAKLRDIEPISLGPWGGPGGDPWTYIAYEGIKEITIFAKENIKSISFTDITGLHSGTFGGKNLHDIGERHTVTIDCPSEYLIAISGTYGRFANLSTITSLSFTTNKTTYGPYGTPSVNSFSIPINNANKIVGFHGSAGHYLDAIGIYVKT